MWSCVLRRKRRALGQIAAFMRNSDGVALLEFAMIAPLWIYTLLAAADLAHCLSIERRLTNASDAVAQLISQQSTGSVVNGTITDAELTLDFYSVMTTFPDVLGDAFQKNESWSSDIQITASSVIFGPQATCVTSDTATPVKPICTTATAVWSVGLSNTGFTQYRPCGAMTVVQPSTPTPNYTTLPSGLYVPGSVIVVDITYVFTPTFNKWLTGSFTIQRSAYITPRFYTQLTYSPSEAGTKSGNVMSYSDLTSNPLPLKGCTFNMASLP